MKALFGKAEPPSDFDIDVEVIDLFYILHMINDEFLICGASERL